MSGLQIQPHDGSITQWVFPFFTTTSFKDLVYGQSSSHWQRLRVSSSRGFFPFLPRTIPTSTDQQGGISFHTTHMGKITHTHSPRTGVESSTTYLRVRICAYSPRTGIRSKCLQNPWGVTLAMEPDRLRRLQDAVGFSFFTTTNRRIPTGTTTVGFSFFTTTNQQIPTGTTYTGLP